MKTTIPGLLVLLLIAPAAQAANRGQQYILLFKQPNASAPPPVVLDAVVGAGGKVEAQGIDRVRVTLPPEAAEAMRKHPGTRWLQRAVPGVEAVRVAGAQLAGSAPRPGNLRAESQAGRLEQQPTAGWASGTYAYDGSGNIVAIGTSTYGYDALSRLTEASLEGATVHYEYDANGNMTGRTSAMLEASSLTQSVDASNHLTGATYDEAGNVTSYAGESYTYDPLSNMQTKTSNGTRELYLYTAGDERIGVRSGEDHWLWSLRDERGRVLRQYETSEWTPAVGWTWIEDYVYREGELLGAERMAEEGGRRHFHLDHLGTPRLITGGGGSMIARHDYTPFGDEITLGDAERRQGFSRDEPMRFTGHERDLTPGTTSPQTSYTDYMHTRVASTGWGRFLSVDPVIDFKTNLRNPQGWNRYSYVRNNPMRWTDPTGKVIAYDDEFRKRVKNDAEFRKAFEAWKQTKSGAAQWRTMGRDTNTVYKFSVGKVVEATAPLKFEQADGRTLPVVGARNENRAGKLDMANVLMTINADYVKSNHAAVPEMISSAIAKTIFHEATHGLDIGSGTRSAAEAWRTEELLGKGIEPRMQLFERELNQILPPPDWN